MRGINNCLNQFFEKHMKFIFCLLFINFFVYNIQAQIIQRSAISTFGNSISQNGLYLSQTAGQGSIAVQTESDGVILNQGFEQAIALYLNQVKQHEIQLRVYPNPNNGNFSIALDLPRNTNFTYAIFDAAGKLIHSDSGVSGQETPVQLGYAISPGAYMLKLESENGAIGKTTVIVQ
jgi:hypothetical protein